MSSDRLTDAAPKLQDGFVQTRLEYQAHYPGQTLLITCTYRSPEEQQALYAKGRTVPGQIVTQIDGITKLSKHNVMPSNALDFAVVINGKVSWDVEEYEPVGEIAQRYGLVWGGAWPHFKDYPHLELLQ